MYKVFYDDQLLYLPGDQELIIFNTKLELADNKSGSFEFDIPAVNPMYDICHPGRKRWGQYFLWTHP